MKHSELQVASTGDDGRFAGGEDGAIRGGEGELVEFFADDLFLGERDFDGSRG